MTHYFAVFTYDVRMQCAEIVRVVRITADSMLEAKRIAATQVQFPERLKLL